MNKLVNAINERLFIGDADEEEENNFMDLIRNDNEIKDLFDRVTISDMVNYLSYKLSMMQVDIVKFENVAKTYNKAIVELEMLMGGKTMYVFQQEAMEMIELADKFDSIFKGIQKRQHQWIEEVDFLREQKEHYCNRGE